ncbi:MAG: urate hydroxylase PuuD [Oceanospirillales bacterium]|uniref:urate hydroxylase PuuD n=1 Tax=Marinobacter maritimus TaxID=277961 RepID=UPI000BD31AF8|nr:urate hydroxylase PuuD [Marinobacter maritimus]MBL1271263.1 urate hydroxylase PuuD [Oceanospirillales bacterium]
MEAYLSEWLSLLVRWFHVIAGVAWIGASFYFVWLDNHLREPPEWKKQEGIKGDLWAIHGGGIYEIAKYKLSPREMPKELHWFKWEAYSTLLSGLALLFVVYYMGSPGYLIDPSKADISIGTAIAIGLSTIVVVLAMYEALIRSPLADNGKAFGLILFAILLVADWGLFQVFTGRGAYIHVGAIIGTIMVANVFLGIVPSQRALVKAIEKGGDPGARVARLAMLAKLRSTHNNYLTLPILLIMISNHYPLLYGHPHGWAVLAAIGFIAAFARHYFNLRHRDINQPWILVVAALLIAILIWAIAPAPLTSEAKDGQAVSDETASAIISTHCVACHASAPSHPAFQSPPAGFMFEELSQLKSHAGKVRQVAVDSQYMPLGNVTGMSDEERQQLGQWLMANQQE